MHTYVYCIYVCIYIYIYTHTHTHTHTQTLTSAVFFAYRYHSIILIHLLNYFLFIFQNTDICIYWGTEDEEGKAVYSLRILSACHLSSVCRGILLLFLIWEFPALRSDYVIACLSFVSSLPASSNPGQNGTVYLCLITVEGDKPTLTKVRSHSPAENHSSK